MRPDGRWGQAPPGVQASCLGATVSLKRKRTRTGTPLLNVATDLVSGGQRERRRGQETAGAEADEGAAPTAGPPGNEGTAAGR